MRAEAFVISAILTIFGFNLSAQSALEEACVYLVSEDTLCGWIDMKQSARNPGYCFYKSNKKGKVQHFSTDALTGYRLNNGRYFVPRRLGEGEEQKDVFVEYLVDGMIDLYIYSRQGQKVYLMDIGNERSLEMVRRPYYAENNEEIYDPVDKRYQGVLKAAMADCPTLYDEIDHLALSSKSLREISVKYHKLMCTSGEECIDYMKAVEPDLGAFSLFSGASYSHLEFVSEEQDGQLGMNSSMGFFLGGQASFPLGGSKLWTRLNVGLSVGKREFEGQLSRPEDPGFFYSFAFENTYIEPVLGIMLHQNRNGLRCLGGIYGITYLNVGSDMQSYRFPLGELVEEGGRVPSGTNYPNVMPGLMLEAGFLLPVLKNSDLSLQLRYEWMYTRKEMEHIYAGASRLYSIRDNSLKLALSFFF